MRGHFPRVVWAILLVALGVATNSPAQSPWVRSKAGFYLQAGWQTTPRYETIFSATGNKQPLDRRLTESTLQFYGEYGVTRHTTIVVSLPWRFQKAGAFLGNTPQPITAAGSLTGLGNISLSLRQSILRGQWPLTGSLRVDLPINRYDNLTGLRTGYRALTILPMVSTGHRDSRRYWFAYAGYALRTDDYHAYTNVGIEAGYLIKKVWAIAFSDLMLPTSNTSTLDISPNNLLTGLYVDNQAYWSLGLKGIFEVHRFWGLTASATAAVWGKRVPQQPAFGVGAYFKWD